MVPNNHLQEWLWFLLSSEGNVSREEPHTVLHSVGKTPIHINVKHKSNQQQQKHSKLMVKDNSIYQKLFPSRTWKVIISAVWLSLMLYCKQNWGIWLWPSWFILYTFVIVFISSAALEQWLYITQCLATESWMDVCYRVLYVRSKRIHDTMDAVWQWLHHQVCVHGVSDIIHTQKIIIALYTP